MSTQEKVEELVLTETQASNGYHLVLYNDDFNTFDHVIFTLIKVCEHSAEQAEQCSLIVHYKGKCSVKSGTLFDLKPRLKKLTAADLTAAAVALHDKYYCENLTIDYYYLVYIATHICEHLVMMAKESLQ